MSQAPGAWSGRSETKEEVAKAERGAGAQQSPATPPLNVKVTTPQLGPPEIRFPGAQGGR